MMRQYELVEKVASYKPDLDEALLNRAYVYAMQKHGSQKRASGDPYFSHPLEVAAILTEMHLDEATIAVALLHDTIEDTDATRKEIDQLFGSKIGQLVEGLTKLKRLDLVSKKAEQAENLRKLLLAIADDIRVLLVKLADRLHNMRTLGHMRQDKRMRIAQETMDIYAPLAGRMGMQDMREELEDLAFRHVNAEAYETITARLAELREKHAATIAQIEKDLTERLAGSGITAKVKGRQKKPYSVFSKMQRKALSLEQLSDIFGFRVIVGDEDDCYRTLGIVHRAWPMVPGRFKDYISIPKQNDYRSIHTTIVGPSRQRVELQIRTRDMHQIAEQGVAAHAVYKEAEPGREARVVLSTESNAFAWLRRTIELLADGDNPEEFLEHTKLELFQDQVFCFTPKGRLIALPRGATPIDFAYAVHTDVGDTCVGAKIDGRIMPVVTELGNGDEVEIIRSKGATPPAAWETIAVTGKARAAIRKSTRLAIRRQYAGLGQQMLARSFSRSGKTFTREGLKPYLGKLGHREIDDALAAVGRGEIATADVLRAVHPDFQDSRVTKPGVRTEEDGWFQLRAATGMMFRIPSIAEAEKQGLAIPIRGAGVDTPVQFCEEGAVPGDRIVGILDPGRGITVYPIQSPALAAFDDHPERWVDVRWDISSEMSTRFPARVQISVSNEPGTLAEVAETIAANDANIHNLSMVKPAPDITSMVIDLEVWDLQHLTRTLNQLRAKPCVSEASRLNG
ncbi:MULTISPECIES: RelA/SpoT family protein [unclassified Aureimonas]|uniref:RelA/SpoT family protein n=1 Tax=unclassified Aureimonas TaxID=2615206 RepID=UPI0006F75D17|nr:MULTISPECIES: bifunctional (p)ppGpp synthetase/guanosine-3',5'-bis(diphosphate) 3'-pyrophosphohydrolase [unclassified Aureimonas]KQT55307.1 GTP pyrophosphokinase [Aureimonas sp. Leaf427]KQT71098.1 GTP pyrophosphokinase [Aureimonas sp. Leaf460]